MRTRLLTTAALLLAASVLGAATGCARSDIGAGVPGGGAGTHVLDGSTWRLVAWTVSAIDPRDFTITAMFAHGRISGDSAVNSYGGPYTAGPGRRFTPGDLAVTAMGGLGPDMKAESAYLSLLGKATSFARHGDRLTLSDRRGDTILVYQAAD